MRSAEFDREAVLRNAIEAFVEKGYAKTSMQDLKKATGLHPGSIYCAFENKQGLMLAAIAQYDQDKTDEFIRVTANAPSAMASLWSYLESIVDEISHCESGPHRACMTQKAVTELINEPEIETALRSSLAKWQNGLQQLFVDALECGEISDERSPELRTKSLVMGIFGLRNYAQLYSDSAITLQLAKQLFDDVRR